MNVITNEQNIKIKKSKLKIIVNIISILLIIGLSSYIIILKTKTVNLKSTNKEVSKYDKPVLYIYPKKDNTKVTVIFEKPEELLTTYPLYKDKWNVTVNKNGIITDSKKNSYYGLYWEEKTTLNEIDFQKGYYVTKENAISFLEEKLKYIGLTDRERNEFIIYWLPVLEKNEKSVVHFETTEEREEFNKLKIKPKPDSILRFAMHIKKVEKEPHNLEKQGLKHFNRKGFTVVEWGGVIHKD